MLNLYRQHLKTCEPGKGRAPVTLAATAQSGVGGIVNGERVRESLKTNDAPPQLVYLSRIDPVD